MSHDGFILLTYPVLFPPVAWEGKTSSWWPPRWGQRPCLGRPTAGCGRTWSTSASRRPAGTSSSARSAPRATCPTRASAGTAACCPWSRSWWERSAPEPLQGRWCSPDGRESTGGIAEVLEWLKCLGTNNASSRQLLWLPGQSCCWENDLVHLAGHRCIPVPSAWCAERIVLSKAFLLAGKIKWKGRGESNS